MLEPQDGSDGTVPCSTPVPRRRAWAVAPLAYSMRPLVVDASSTSRRCSAALTRPSPSRRGRGQDLDDDIDALDEVDPTCSPSSRKRPELLPRLGCAAPLGMAGRQPGRGAHETLRALHTLKGSARLAGAMRLGEMAHRLESAVERLDGESRPTAEQIEPLLGSFDALQAGFDAAAIGR